MNGLVLRMTLCLSVLSAAAVRADELTELISLAISNSPTLQSARAGTLQAEAAHQATGEFLDPKTTATAGRLHGAATAAPLLGTPSGLPTPDSYGAAAAVEVPVQPGVYAGAGVSEQYLLNPPESADTSYRTLVGAQIRIPLLQDRGFSLWRLKAARMKELQMAAEAHLQETRQVVRHAVELAYYAYLTEVANATTSKSATDRAHQLLKEAEELVRLKVVPEYQLAPARLELALRREEFCAANQAVDNARLRLIQILGTTPSIQLTTNSNALTDRATDIKLPELDSASLSFAARGAISEITALSAAAATETRSLNEQLRPDLGLSLSGVWATDDSTFVSDNGDSSAAAVLVWTRPWSQTGAKARLRESRAREAQLAAARRELQNQLTTDLATAKRDFTGAGERLKEISIAVDQARRTLEAESERFRLGEGRSRNVLDAQNDLTKAYRARNSVVWALLKGHSDFRFATGYIADTQAVAESSTPGGPSGGHQ